jgi:O-ureido-D-serine cyclo-ligase
MQTDQRPIALVTARAVRDLDEDLAPLVDALAEFKLQATVVDWDDPAVDWSDFALALLRSTWDCHERLGEFLPWLERVAAVTTVHNPPRVVRWALDKHYLAELEHKGVAIVPSQFVEPGDSAAGALQQFLRQHPSGDLVIKPAIGAGSRDAQRHTRDAGAAILQHISRLLAERRSVLLQPYQERVDEQGETALVFFEGRFSHAICKGALLQRGSAPTPGPFAPEIIAPRTPGRDELAVAERALAALPFDPPLYARLDLVRRGDGSPGVLEFELAEPSLFLAYSTGTAALLAGIIAGRLRASGL